MDEFSEATGVNRRPLTLAERPALVVAILVSLFVVLSGDAVLEGHCVG